MLDALGGGDQGCVEDVGVGALLHHLLAFLEQPFHALAVVTGELLTRSLSDLLETAKLLLRLLQMCLERLTQLGVRRLLDHLRQALR